MAALSAKKFEAGTLERARPKPPRFALYITVISFAILYFPLVILVITSFRGEESQWTLKWYQKVFEDEALKESLAISLWVGLWSTLISCVIGTSLALALDRFKFPGKRLLDSLQYVPLIMPEIVMGLALLIWFVILNISLGQVSLVLAHVTFCLSYVVITVRARLADFDESLEEAARDLGAQPWQTFWKITFPLIWPAILSGALLAFTISFDDFMISFFTAGVGSDPLPVKLFSMIRYGLDPSVNAISSLILGATVAVVLLMMSLDSRKKTQN